MAREKMSLEDMAKALYDDDELADAVVKDADRLKTRAQIESGELVLPHPIDARVWHDRTTGRVEKTDAERAQAAQIIELQRRLEALESAPHPHGEA